MSRLGNEHEEGLIQLNTEIEPHNINGLFQTEDMEFPAVFKIAS